MRKALLVVSFGTTYLDTLDATVGAVERALARAFPDRELRRAFTSRIVRKRLLEKRDIEVDDVPGALERLSDEGFEDVLVQSTHIIPGYEFDDLKGVVTGMRHRFDRLVLGEPLLMNPDDLISVADAMMPDLGHRGEDEALVLLAHGTGNFVNAAYPALEYALWDRGWVNAFVGTVEGYPGIEQVEKRLGETGTVEKVTLAPFLLVAGEHAVRDMAGDRPDSWKSQLSDLGYEVECLIRGLGEYPSVQGLFVEHARRVLAG